jgi:hypothetical protein
LETFISKYQKKQEVTSDKKAKNTDSAGADYLKEEENYFS